MRWRLCGCWGWGEVVGGLCCRGLSGVFESWPLVQGGERTQGRVVDAHYADDFGVDAEDDAVGGA